MEDLEIISCDLFECLSDIDPQVVGIYIYEDLNFCSKDCLDDFLYENDLEDSELSIEMDCCV